MLRYGPETEKCDHGIRLVERIIRVLKSARTIPQPHQVPDTIMGAGAVAVTGETTGWAHLIDPTRKWYNNGRRVVTVVALVCC